MQNIIARLAQELRVEENRIRAAVALLDGGATVPFIARYRKEATGELDDVQLREIEARLASLREFDERLQTILRSIEGQGQLTPALRAALESAATRQELEDLYLPFKPRRRTRGQMAREAGLDPLADRLWADPALDPAEQALAFLRPAPAEGGDDFSTLPAVLDGVRDLWSERWADDARVLAALRDWLWQDGQLHSRLREGLDPAGSEASRYRDYFDYREALSHVPSHRALAVFRGRAQDILEVRLVAPDAVEPPASSGPARSASLSLAEARIAAVLGWRHQARAADDLIRRALAWTWRVKLSLSLERDLFARLREEAEQVAVQVFATNLRHVLMAAPAGNRVVMGLDPGLRTGVKVAVVDATGKLLATATVYPHEPRRDWDAALRTLADLCVRHGVALVAVGNGTAGRETDALAGELAARLQQDCALHIDKLLVSEAGASVYSASEFASREMPDVDVSLRGAASIARRLQDPLAELVKIEPKAIGVGQYQHDVNQAGLARTLDAVVEDCVNAVGVDLNTASEPLLARVSGLSRAVARALVQWRETHGAFRDRQQLLQVPGLGPRTFEQCAGFLRIRGGDNPLDLTGVHPETYPLVQRILNRVARPVQALMGQTEVLRALQPQQFADERFGAITVRDILAELEKPGRDPRPDFRVARLAEGVRELGDLRPGMQLEGTVTNVAAFGAFVDIGVHQDGLVHVSQLSRRFVTDAHQVVKAGDIVQVRVLEVDLARRRVALSMKPAESGARAEPASPRFEPAGAGAGRRLSGRTAVPAGTTAMASAFAKLRDVR